MKAIMYHYVRYPQNNLPNFQFLHFDDFCKQLDYFQENFVFPKKADFFDMFTTHEPLKDNVVLTFDDAFIDHYEYVLPELERRELWGIFYVPTAILTSHELLDVHRVHVLLGAYGGKEILAHLAKILTLDMTCNISVEKFEALTYVGQTDCDSRKQCKRILNFFVKNEYRKTLLDKLMLHFFPNEVELSKEYYLTSYHIREMQHRGMLIGSHTVRHPVLSKLSSQEQEDEIVNSFLALEQLGIGIQKRLFCYPHGGFHTFNQTTEELLKKHKCEFAFNVESRDIEAKDLIKRPYALPRYDCNLFPYGQCFKQGVETHE